MATANLSAYEKKDTPSAVNYQFGIVVSDWNKDVTHKLLDGAYKTLLDYGAHDYNIIVKHVPGSFELTTGAKFMIEYTNVDAVIALGSVIKGETPHFDYVCQGVTQGITDLNVKYNIPVVFGLLTTNNQKQAENRAGGKHGNKGDEAAVTAIRMADLHLNFKTRM